MLQDTLLQATIDGSFELIIPHNSFIHFQLDMRIPGFIVPC